MPTPKYKRVLLKISGEALIGKKEHGIVLYCIVDYIG